MESQAQNATDVIASSASRANLVKLSSESASFSSKPWLYAWRFHPHRIMRSTFFSSATLNARVAHRPSNTAPLKPFNVLWNLSPSWHPKHLSNNFTRESRRRMSLHNCFAKKTRRSKSSSTAFNPFVALSKMWFRGGTSKKSSDDTEQSAVAPASSNTQASMDCFWATSGSSKTALSTSA